MWLRPGGHIEVSGPGPGAGRSDAFTCGHCSRIVEVKAKQDPAALGGLCKVCMRLICPHCLDNGCRPFEKQLEAWEARDRLRRDIGLE